MVQLLTVMLSLCLALPALAQDPVKVDPSHHKTEVDNDQVRVLRITLGPHEKTPMHEHPASVAVFLTDIHSRVSPTGGKPDETPRKRGAVLAVQPGTHTVENLSGTGAEVMLVELKTPPATNWSGLAQDGVKLDPKHYTVEQENDRVRVLRIKYGPREKSVMHDHPATVVVFLTDARFQFTGPGGKPGESSRPPVAKAGQAMWAGAEKHLPENLSDEPFEAILVELKTRAGGKTER